MATKQINLQGIVRNQPDNNVVDGAMQELINLRPWEGALRPVGQKAGVASTPSDVRFIHVINESIKIYIGVVTGKINYWIYLNGELSGTAVTTSIDAVADMSFASMRNALMISNRSSKKTAILLFNLDTMIYTEFADQIEDLPFITIAKTASTSGNKENSVTCTTTDLPDTQIAEYMKMINDRADLGYINGNVLVRCAWELSDGTLIKHTIPDLLKVSSIAQTSVLNTVYTVTTTFTAYNLQYKLEADATWLTNFRAKYKNLIRYLNIYISLPRSPETDERTVDDGRRTYDVASISEYLPEVQSESYFLLKQIPVESLVADTLTTITVDTILDLSTKSQLTVDNFSHHKLYGKNLFTYNSRIFLSNIVTTLCNGYPLTGMIKAAPDAITGTDYEVAIEYDIILSGGRTARVFSGWKTMNAYNSVTNEIEFHLQRSSEVTGSRRTASGSDVFSYWGYPDSRARSARVYVRQDGVIHLKLSIGLSVVQSQNFSYAKGYIIKGPLNSSASLNQIINTYEDNNRVQATELSNPFYFPAINSYRIGDGQILALSTNAIALSQGQFGQFPIFCFTSEGIWAMNIGDGEVLISSIVPLSREVCNNPASITAIDGGVVFSTDKGLFILPGAKPVDLSDQVEGKHTGWLTGSLSYDSIMNNPNLYQIKSSLCSVSFLTYLSGAKIAYDYKREELIISNSTYNYSWVFSLKYKSWFKISQVFDRFVSAYPYVFGYHMEDSIYKQFNLSEESYPALRTVHLETRPMKFGSRNFKKLHRMLLDGLINNNIDNPFSIHLFGSTDGSKWYLLNNGNTFTSRTPLLVGRSAFSCLMFILVCGGNVDKDTYFTNLDVEVEERWSQKIR